MLRYTASVGFDRRLALADIEGSLAHAAMLQQCDIISAGDLAEIRRGLQQIRAEIERGQFEWRVELEDVHLNIEKRLTDLVGDAGKRLHTGRSRNDQVATDTRLWLRAEIDRIVGLLDGLQHALVELAERHAETVMPGFTHMQVAQPVTFGHHLLAYTEMFERDRSRLLDARKRVNCLPLGAAALAGTTYPINRTLVAQTLGFESICENSLDAVSDRDFAIEFCAAAALVMTHISRLAEELVIWLSPRYAFIRLPDRYTTGSSIMPQKRNPDVPELARGKTGRVIGHLVALLTLMKGQPLAYNKDNQEDKEPLFDTVDTVADTLRAFSEMLPGIEVDAAAMRRAAEEGYCNRNRPRRLPRQERVSRFATHTKRWRARSGSRRIAASLSLACRSRSCKHSRRTSIKTRSTRCRSTARWPRAITRAERRRSECTRRLPSGGSALAQRK